MTTYSAFGRYGSMHLFHKGEDKLRPTDELTLKKLDSSKLAKEVGRALSDATYSDFVIDGRRRLIFNSTPQISVTLSSVSEGVSSAGRPYIAGTMKETRGIGWAVTVKSEDLGKAKQLAKKLSALIGEDVTEQANDLWNAVQDNAVSELDTFLNGPSRPLGGPCAKDLWGS